MIDTLLEAKTESYFGKSVNEHYEPNNETFFTYLLEKNNVDYRIATKKRESDFYKKVSTDNVSDII
ncbi:MAG: hypothetical protein ACPGVD_03340, partial [Flavobacteriales bacterium]